MNANPPATQRERAMLSLIHEHQARGVRPSQFAYLLLDAGVIQNRRGTAWKPQGAGRIGGSLLARLERAGWIQGTGLYGRDFRLTQQGVKTMRGGMPPGGEHD